MRALSLLVGLALNVHGAEIAGIVRAAGTNPVAQAIVYLNAGNGHTPASNLVLRVHDGILEPHVHVAARGGSLVLRNEDATLHVVRLERLNGTNAPSVLWTQAMPYAGFQREFLLSGFRETTLLRIAGGNGENITGYVAVLPHPWATLTDAEGRFALRDVPVGPQRVFVWHEALGTLVREVRVPAQGVTLEFPATP